MATIPPSSYGFPQNQYYTAQTGTTQKHHGHHRKEMNEQPTFGQGSGNYGQGSSSYAVQSPGGFSSMA